MNLYIYQGFGHGSNIEKSHVFKNSINLHSGDNQITFLAMTVGLPVTLFFFFFFFSFSSNKYVPYFLFFELFINIFKFLFFFFQM